MLQQCQSIRYEDWLGFGLGLGKDSYPNFLAGGQVGGGWVGGWVVGGIKTKASPLAWLWLWLRAWQYGR